MGEGLIPGAEGEKGMQVGAVERLQGGGQWDLAAHPGKGKSGLGQLEDGEKLKLFVPATLLNRFFSEFEGLFPLCVEGGGVRGRRGGGCRDQRHEILQGLEL